MLKLGYEQLEKKQYDQAEASFAQARQGGLTLKANLGLLQTKEARGAINDALALSDELLRSATTAENTVTYLIEAVRLRNAHSNTSSDAVTQSWQQVGKMLTPNQSLDIALVFERSALLNDAKTAYVRALADPLLIGQVQRHLPWVSQLTGTTLHPFTQGLLAQPGGVSVGQWLTLLTEQWQLRVRLPVRPPIQDIDPAFKKVLDAYPTHEAVGFALSQRITGAELGPNDAMVLDAPLTRRAWAEGLIDLYSRFDATEAHRGETQAWAVDIAPGTPWTQPILHAMHLELVRAKDPARHTFQPDDEVLPIEAIGSLVRLNQLLSLSE